MLALAGCAGVKGGGGAGGGSGGSGGGSRSGTGTGTGTGTGLTDGSASVIDRPPPVLVGEVYAHSQDTLFLLEPHSKTVTVVGRLDCLDGSTPPASIFDIAIDKGGNMVASLAIPLPNGGGLGGGLASVDKTTAKCTIIKQGSDLYPTSLTYVPEGTLLTNVEALVGFQDDRYVRIDPATGNMTDIGPLNNTASGGVRWVSSGDIVSITGAGTYLTVHPDSGAIAGGDRIVQVDPRTGALMRIIGATGTEDVLGLGY
jgi:hypothetical protein